MGDGEGGVVRFGTGRYQKTNGHAGGDGGDGSRAYVACESAACG